MSALTVIGNNALTSATDKADLVSALKNSLYPGASDSSIEMVLAYCQAGGYDPMTKPVHIVPMWDKNAKSMRDTIMPGIGLYRIIADRSGKYAGQDDVVYGPILEGWGIKFPEWCKVTVYKITPVGRVPYPATVRWLESYATANKDVDTPNAMWRKRPFGQLEKCAEAAALRKAFPEIGAQPTADEMQGKMFEMEELQPANPPATVADSKSKSRSEELKAKINESLIRAGAMPAIIPGAPLEVDPDTGELIQPGALVALITSIQTAPHKTALKSLKSEVIKLDEPWQSQAKAAYNARLAEFSEPTSEAR